MTSAHGKLFDALWLLAIGAISSAWCATAWTEVGPTFDEPVYVEQGLATWKTGSNKQLMTWGVMPFPLDLQTLPLHLWEKLRGEEFHPIGDLDRLLPVARAASLPFWWAMLLYGMLWGRRLGGPWAGRIACALMASDPNLLGHAALATTDICLTAAVLMATYHFTTARQHSWFWRVLLPGFLYGIALTVKASALPYVPLLCALFGMHHLRQTGQLAGWNAGRMIDRFWFLWAATYLLRWDLAYMMAIGLIYTFGYVGCDWNPEPTFVDWAQKLPDGQMKDVMLPLSERLRIFPNAGEGLIQQIKHNMRGHGGAFLAGQRHDRAVWYYFPVALTIKVPDATLALLAVLVLLRPRAMLNPAGVAALILLAFSLNTRVQIGVRIVFPLMVFAMIGMAVAIARTDGIRRSVLAMLVSVAVLANAAESLMLWPDAIRYTNRLWGGTETGHKHLADSNYDWGQGLPELRRWWAANGEPPLIVWYYGCDPSILLRPFRVIQVPWLPERTPVAVKKIVGDSYFAVGYTVLTNCPREGRDTQTLETLDWLNGLEPVARTTTFAIYKLPNAEPGR